MKKIFLLPLLLLSILMTNCKPDPTPGEDDDNFGNDTLPETPLVRKYLVREYIDDWGKPMLIIDWNDDFTRINQIITDSGGIYQVNYHFKYYDEDSIKVYITLPEVNQGFYTYTNYMCHLKDGRINQIDMYFKENPKDTRLYVYDDQNRLIKAGGTNFVWEDNNVIIKWGVSDTINYSKNYGQHYHPYYTLPYLLPSCSYFSSFGSYITQPLWENISECTERGCYEHDSDGYVTYTYHITEEGTHQPFRHYEYDY